MLCAESAAVGNSPAATRFRVMTEEDSEGEEVIILKVSPARRPNAKQRCLQTQKISTPSPSEVILISDDEEGPSCSNMSSKRQRSLEDYGYTSPSKRPKFSANAGSSPGCLHNGLPPLPKSPLCRPSLHSPRTSLPPSPKYVSPRPSLPSSPKPVLHGPSLPSSPKSGLLSSPRTHSCNPSLSSPKSFLHKPSLQSPKPGHSSSPKLGLPSPKVFSPRPSLSSPKSVSRRLSLPSPKPGLSPSPKRRKSDDSHFHYTSSQSPHRQLSVSDSQPNVKRLHTNSSHKPPCSPVREKCSGAELSSTSNTSSHFQYSSSQSPQRPLSISDSPPNVNHSHTSSPPKPHCSPVRERGLGKYSTSHTSSHSSSETSLSPKADTKQHRNVDTMPPRTVPTTPPRPSEPSPFPKSDTTPPRTVPTTPPSPSISRTLTSFSAGASPGHRPSTKRAKTLLPMWPLPSCRSPFRPNFSSTSSTRHTGSTSPTKAPPSSSPSLSAGTQHKESSSKNQSCSTANSSGYSNVEPSCSTANSSGYSNVESSCSTANSSGYSNVEPSCSTSNSSGYSNVESSCSTANSSGYSNVEPSCSTANSSGYSNVEPSCSTANSSGYSNVEPSCSTANSGGYSNVEPSCSTANSSGYSNVEPSCSTANSSGYSNVEPSCSTANSSGYSNVEPSCSTANSSGYSNVEPSCSTANSSGYSNVEPSLSSPQRSCHPLSPQGLSSSSTPGRTPALIQPPQMMVSLPYCDATTTHKPISRHEVNVFVQNYMSGANLHKAGSYNALNYLSVVEKLVSQGAYIPTHLLKQVLTQVQRACDEEFVRRMYAILSHDLTIRSNRDILKEEVVWEAMEQSLNTLQRHLISHDNTPQVNVFAAETVLNYLFGLLVKDLNSRVENPSTSLVKKTLSLRSKWSRIIKVLDVLFSVYQNSRGVSSHPGVPDVREVLLAMICLPLLTCEDIDRKEMALRLARELSERLETLGSTERKRELLLAIPSDYLRERVISIHLNRNFVMRPSADSSSDLTQCDNVSLATIGLVHLSRMPYNHSNTPQDLGFFLFLLCHLLQSHLHTLHACPILSFLTPSSLTTDLPPSWLSLPSPLSREELRASLLSICHPVQTLMFRLLEDPVFLCEITVPTNWLYLQLLTSLTEPT